MKDNLLRAEAADIMDESTNWLSQNGMRHSIRPRRASYAKVVHPLDDTPLAELFSEAAAPKAAETIKDAPVLDDTDTDVPEIQSPAVKLPEAEVTMARLDDTIADDTPDRVAPVRVTPARRIAAPAPMITPEHMPPVPERDMPQWQDLQLVEAGARRAQSSAMPVVDADRDSLSVQAFDLLRTRLRRTMQENGWVNIAVTAPTRGCGTTFTALNLALSLSRIPQSRTVLMDLNLRNPGLARALDLQVASEMRDFLSGAVPMGDHMQRISDTLALGLNAAPDPDAAETLQNPALPRTLDRMRAALRPDIVIYDLPPMLGHDDVSAFLPQLDGVLLVSDGTQTMGKQLVECERMLDGQVPLLGVVLNRARASSLTRYR
jgi:Mrp family chromosome partitioning ATPase